MSCKVSFSSLFALFLAAITPTGLGFFWRRTPSPPPSLSCLDRVVTTTLNGRACETVAGRERGQVAIRVVACLCAYFGHECPTPSKLKRQPPPELMIAYSEAITGWEALCRWQSMRRTLAASEDALRDQAERKDALVRAARAAVAGSRRLLRAQKRQNAAVKRLIDADAGFRQMLSSLQGPRRSLPLMEEKMRNEIEKINSGVKTTAEKKNHRVLERLRVEAEKARIAQIVAAAGLGAHILVMMGVTGRMRGRQGCRHGALIVGDAVLVLDGKYVDSWWLRYAALMMLLLHVAGNARPRVRPQAASRHRRQHEKRCRQPLFLSRSLKRATLGRR